HLINSNNVFDPNFRADAADQLGARLRLRTQLGRNPNAPRMAGELSLGGETGDYTFLRPEALLRLGTPLFGGVALGIEAAAGTVEGDAVPAQAFWRLGGASTVRGYRGSAAIGERYWRTRTELGFGITGARLALFSDAGWAGPRAQLQSRPSLLSAGVGGSFLDGLLRVDLARALRGERGWRLHLHFNGVL
ncbi:MAG TPA: ShlB/FhaC/HecB family hemolysin secretion/activation protein, partial [Longimicrobiales bacterium]|nr:ShlB/FhaC/HecB family hemolysin secretion/activation protein [Longimicrobiales bacterium]